MVYDLERHICFKQIIIITVDVGTDLNGWRSAWQQLSSNCLPVVFQLSSKSHFMAIRFLMGAPNNLQTAKTSDDDWRLTWLKCHQNGSHFNEQITIPWKLLLFSPFNNKYRITKLVILKKIAIQISFEPKTRTFLTKVLKTQKIRT